MDSHPQAGATAQQEPDQTGNPRRPTPAITLQTIRPQDPILIKWELGAGLPPASGKLWRQHDSAQNGQSENRGILRLTSPEQPEWECRVPFAELAREGGMVVGRCPQAADIVLPFEYVSRRHALLEIVENGLVITDLNSTNGTSTGEHELTPYDHRVPLTDGMELFLGDASLRIEYIR